MRVVILYLPFDPSTSLRAAHDRPFDYAQDPLGRFVSLVVAMLFDHFVIYTKK
jgi:hypothetical protein